MQLSCINFLLTVTSSAIFRASQIIILTSFVVLLSVGIKRLTVHVDVSKTAGKVANSVDPDQIQIVASDLSCHRLLRTVCPHCLLRTVCLLSFAQDRLSILFAKVSVFIVCSGLSVYIVCSGLSVCIVCSRLSVYIVCSGLSVYIVCSGLSVYFLCSGLSVYFLCSGLSVYNVCSRMSVPILRINGGNAMEFIQQNFNDSNIDSSFIMADSNSFMSP